MHNPLSQKELYEKLGKLSKKMTQLDEKGEATLTSTEVEIMQEVYPSVAVLSGQSMAIKLNTTCAACIKEALYVMSSLYNRIKIAEELKLENGGITIEPEEEQVDYSDQLPRATVEEQIKGLNLGASDNPVQVPTPPAETPLPVDGVVLNAPGTESSKQVKEVKAKKAPAKK